MTEQESTTEERPVGAVRWTTFALLAASLIGATLAMLLMGSWMITVLPTPAPPKRPVLPPFT